LLNTASQLILRQVKRRTTAADRTNRDTLATILRTNAGSEYGRTRSFSALAKSADVAATYRTAVPLTEYADYASAIDRIAQGETNILTTEPVVLLAGTSGTTDTPKRIPTTARGQYQAAALLGIAPRAVIQNGILRGLGFGREINLMSLFVPPKPAGGVSLTAAPNAGMRRIRPLVPALYTSPVEAFEVAHQPSAQYLHALFGLRCREALGLGTPFAPQVVGWLGSIERDAECLVADLAQGSLAPHLQLSPGERAAIRVKLRPNRARAREVEAALALGPEGLMTRLWPNLRYINTVTSGSFSACVPRLRHLAGPGIHLHSPAYGASEGVVGVNLETNGLDQYVLAVGSCYFEFIPADHLELSAPATVGPEALEPGQDYEVVITNRSGLYRYRLGDVVRVTGFYGTAPRLDFRYRRGTLLNLVNEKMTEFHTRVAVANALTRRYDTDRALKDYTVLGRFNGSRGEYTFFIELDSQSVGTLGTEFPRLLDAALAQVNPYYQLSGRDLDRLSLPLVKQVHPGTFDRLRVLLAARPDGVSVGQTKIPRSIVRAEHLKLLESGVMVGSYLP
jgi:hypothetical protein